MNMQENRMMKGSEKLSYAQNSLIQSRDFLQSMKLWEDLYTSMTPKCVMVAELGCAIGPNSVKIIPELVKLTYDKYKAMGKKDVPQIKVFLNDLHFNDFNNVSTSLPSFLQSLQKERHGDLGLLSISMTPGSYQKRVFPDNFLHFVHCANSAHWLTKVPKVLSDEGELLTKGCIYIMETSPQEVIRAYKRQFTKDFFSFLSSRSKEIVQDGRMVINMMVSSETNGPQNMWIVKLMNIVIREMMQEGLVDEKKVDDFNIPFYPPTMEEVKKLVENEGSFLLHNHETFILDWDMPDGPDKVDETKRAVFVADTNRVATDYLISTQFGEALSDEFHRRFTELVCKHFIAGIRLQTFHQIISLIRK